MSLDDAQRASQAQFDRQSSRYGKSHILSNTADLDEAVAGVSLPAHGNALDIATGGGHAAMWLAKRGFRVTLSDISRRMLENALSLIEAEGYLAESRQHPAEELPYPGRSFDIVTCRVAAHHFSDPFVFVAEAARVLKPEGILVLIDGTVPDSDPEAGRWLNEIEKLRDPSHVRLLSPDEWSRFCLAAGLAIERVAVTELKQPDLEWYFETANTPDANRIQVRVMLESPPPAAQRIFRIASEEGRTVWWWQRLLLVARKSMARTFP